jgi:endonuclease III
VALLAEEYPGSAEELCALRHANPFQLLVATILSAQCTDQKVNEVTPAVFVAYPDPDELARADPALLEALIRPTGFFRSKTKNLIGMAAALCERYQGEVPSAMEDLVTLPGVGRKTANVIRSVAFGLPGLAVDTHVGRLSRRLGLSQSDDPTVVEADVCALVAPEQWGTLSLRLILHGRRVCRARAPDCDSCMLAPLCPSAHLFGQSAESATRRSRRAAPIIADSTE